MRSKASPFKRASVAPRPREHHLTSAGRNGFSLCENRQKKTHLRGHLSRYTEYIPGTFVRDIFMKRLFRVRLLFVVPALIALSLIAPPLCHPFPRTRIISRSAGTQVDVVTFSRGHSRDTDRAPDPEVYIHIRSDRQAETAVRIREKLTQDGYLVPRIIMVSAGPHENQVRYFHDDRARAVSVADELKGIGLKPIAVERIGHYESNPPGRYELWLAPYAR